MPRKISEHTVPANTNKPTSFVFCPGKQFRAQSKQGGPALCLPYSYCGCVVKILFSAHRLYVSRRIPVCTR